MGATQASAHATPIPAVGVIPHLTVSDASGAIDFYKAAFGAVEVRRAPTEDGKRIMHAGLIVNGGHFYLNDDFPEYCGGVSRLPDPNRPTTFQLHLQVDNCDEWFNRAVAAGATAVMAPADMFWGDRYAVIADPYGYRWGIANTIAK